MKGKFRTEIKKLHLISEKTVEYNYCEFLPQSLENMFANEIVRRVLERCQKGFRNFQILITYIYLVIYLRDVIQV